MTTPNKPRAFADTNVVVYALDSDPAKRRKALEILRSRPVLSVQVINVFLSVTVRKGALSRADANRLAAILMRQCETVPITTETVNLAIALGDRHRLNHWDALIIASAIMADCSTLFTEDLNSGQVFEDRLTIINPIS